MLFPVVYLVMCFDDDERESYVCDIFTIEDRAYQDANERKKLNQKRGTRKFYEVQKWEIQE